MTDASEANVCFWSLQTPPGKGAIAVIQLEGEVDALLHALGVKPVRLGGIGLRDLAGIDRGLVVRWSPSCCHLMPHAGPVVVRRLIAAIQQAGARPLSTPMHFPEASSFVEAAMLAVLPGAASPLAVDLLLVQPERWQDFDPTTKPVTARDRQLNRLINAPLVVSVGRPNIGKSSLLNALARQIVAVVADAPGTTRDAVGVPLEFLGLAVRYLDTPGIPETSPQNAIEEAATQAALGLIQHADLLLLCGDVNSEPPAVELSGQSAIRVALRDDLGVPPWRHDVSVSARRGTGLDELARKIRQALVPDEALDSGEPWRFWDDQAAYRWGC